MYIYISGYIQIYSHYIPRWIYQAVQMGVAVEIVVLKHNYARIFALVGRDKHL